MTARGALPRTTPCVRHADLTRRYEPDLPYRLVYPRGAPDRFGTVRFMSSDSTRRKLRIKPYLAKYGDQAGLGL